MNVKARTYIARQILSTSKSIMNIYLDNIKYHIKDIERGNEYPHKQ